MVRIAIILIVRSDGAMFLHRRRADKRVYPDRYGLGAGGHIEAGETPADGAQRELWEETGLRADVDPITDFVFAGPDGPYEVHLFRTTAESIPTPCVGEWASWRWATPAEIAAHRDADELCPDTAEALNRFDATARARG